MDDQLTPTQLQRILLEKLKIQVRLDVSLRQLAFARNHLDVLVRFDEAAQRLVAQLTTFILRGPAEAAERAVERVPADWWQHVKQRWVPTWVLRRWPVRTREIVVLVKTVYRTCPHVNVMTDQRPHLDWLMVDGLNDDLRVVHQPGIH